MTMIVIDKAVVEQVLEALAIGDNIALVGSAYTPKSIDAGVVKMRTAMEVLREALEAPQPQPVQEPVADIKISGDDFDLGLTDTFAFGRLRLPDGHYQLYTSPQAQPARPLTVEQIDALFDPRNGAMQGVDEVARRFARAIEQAHGITKGNQ